VSVPAYLSRGSGDTAVVMLHGVGGGAAAWTPQLDALAGSGYLAVAWDAPGYGATAPIEPYDMANLARSSGFSMRFRCGGAC